MTQTPTMPARKTSGPSVLMQAEELIKGQRLQDYGDPRDSFKTIAQFWSTYTGVKIDSEDVAIMMMLMKVARLTVTPNHRDTQVDIAGYLALLEYIQE